MMQKPMSPSGRAENSRQHLSGSALHEPSNRSCAEQHPHTKKENAAARSGPAALLYADLGWPYSRI